MRPYLDSVRTSLTDCLCLENYSSPLIERHNKPQIEVKELDELILKPIIVSRNDNECVLIEPSINSVRVSIKIKQIDDIDRDLCQKHTRFFMQRADQFSILRRVPMPGYDISFLITNFHTDIMTREGIVDFIIYFMEEADKEISETKIAFNARARIVAEEFLKEVCNLYNTKSI